MSVPALDPTEKPDGGMLGPVSSVMETIFSEVATEPDEPTAGEGEETSPPAGEEPPATGGDSEPPADGEPPAEPSGETEGEPAEPTAVRSAPPVVTADDKALVTEIGTLSEKLDERFSKSFEQQAVEQAQEEYPQYLDLLKMHPLELVGKELPPIDGTEENIILRTAQDVADWQEAVKTILQREMETAIEEKRSEASEVLDVVHASIQLFQDNPDLVPGSKSYNKALASQFVKMAAPYALKMKGKLVGYSIPVQGLVDQCRAQVKAAASAPAATPPAKKTAAAPKPQAGVPSRAGASGGEEEDFSPMWKALGINEMPI